MTGIIAIIGITIVAILTITLKYNMQTLDELQSVKYKNINPESQCFKNRSMSLEDWMHSLILKYPSDRMMISHAYKMDGDGFIIYLYNNYGIDLIRL